MLIVTRATDGRPVGINPLAVQVVEPVDPAELDSTQLGVPPLTRIGLIGGVAGVAVVESPAAVRRLWLAALRELPAGWPVPIQELTTG